jgi:hypothetical protein
LIGPYRSKPIVSRTRPATALRALAAASLVNGAPVLGTPALKSLKPASARSRKSRNQAKLKFRYLPGFWVREDAVNGIVSELEARPEYRDVEMSEERWDELIAQAIQRIIEDRYCPSERRK